MKIFLTALIVFLTGCAHSPTSMNGQIQQTKDLISDTLTDAAQTPELVLEDAPADIMQELSDSLPDRVDQGVFASEYVSEPTFDLSVANAPAHVFYMGLVKDSSENMMVHPDVKGDISLDLKNVTISEVMDLVREVYGYEYKKTRGGYVVLPASLESKVFQVNYLNIIRGGETNMTVNSGQQTSSGSDSGSSASSAASASILTSTKSDFWTSLKETLVSIIGEDKGRTVVVDPHANLVVVKAFPVELRDVEEYLNRTQENLQRQVILEAKIIEVTLSESFQSGIDWAALAKNGATSAILGQVGLSDGSSSILDTSANIKTSSLLSSSESTLSNLFTYGVAGDDFAAIIRLLGTQGDVQVLSSPRISTVNNQKAVIKVGADEYFVTGVSTSSSDNDANSSTSTEADIERFFSGIALDVTPQISEKKEVILHIHPSVSDVTTQIKNFTVNGQTQSLPLAFSKVRESDTIIKAKNGQVVVIGGLMQNVASDEESSVPLLGSIPLLGNLFGQTKKSTTRSELIILLKPIVVGSDATWADYISNTNQRIKELRQPSKDE